MSTSTSVTSPWYAIQNRTTWIVPSISSTFARWLRSAMSSAISGWSSSSRATGSTCSGADDVTSTQTWASGSASASRRASIPSDRRDSPFTHETTRTSAAPSGDEGGVVGSVDVGIGCSRLAGRLLVPGPREHTPPSVEQERWRDRGGGHPGGHEKDPDHDPGCLARRPRLQGLDHEAVLERAVLERRRDE